MAYNSKKNGAANYNSWLQLTDTQISLLESKEGADNTTDPSSERFAALVHLVNGIQDPVSGLSAAVKQNDNTENNELLVNLEGHDCFENATSTPLLADETWTGSGWQDTIDYGVLTISVVTDKDSALDGLEVQWSINGIDVIDADVFSIVGGVSKTFTFGPAHRFYRVQYTNGSEAQTVFNIKSIIRRTYVKPSSHRIRDNIVGDDDAELVKSVLTGVKPDGTFDNANLTQQANLRVSINEYGDTPAIDAFDRLRVSLPYTLFDSKQLHDKQPLFWDESIGGSATSTHNASNACTEMVVTANASDFVIRQTKQRMNYQPGKSQLCLITFYSPEDTGVTKRIGMFDGTGTNNLTPNNGIFLETDGDISWNIAKNGTTTESVTRANWNVDPMDGTGPSLLTLDLDATQIAVIDFEWLGVGRVRVGFVIDGLIRYVHYFNHANDPSFDSVYMSSPNLPLRYDIVSDGTGGGQLDHICGTIMSEGGIEENGVLRTVNTGSTHLDADTIGTTYAMLGLKLKSTYKDITVTPTGISILAATNDTCMWSLILNPTVAGTFTYSDLTDSALQSATGVTANTVTGGIEIGSGYCDSKTSITLGLETALRMGSNIDGTVDSLVLCITPLSTGANVYGSLTFRELL